MKKMIIVIILIAAVSAGARHIDLADMIFHENISVVTEDDIPEYDGRAYIEINGGRVDFTVKELEQLSAAGYERYSSLDSLGRAGEAEACAGRETMPHRKRQSIGMVRPSGWHTARCRYAEGGYLYNRCHLLAYQLTGENANEKNLMTGTRQFNTEGMLPFENRIADYIEKTGHHVAVRVTPVYQSNDLLASGVQMQARSLEDRRLEINVYIYNVQDGVDIDYRTGEHSCRE